MSASSMTRRRLMGIAALMAAAVPATAFGQTDSNARFRGVAVDVTYLLDRGGGNPIRVFAQVLQDRMQRVFADRLSPRDPRAPLLIAKLRSVSFQSFIDRSSAFKFGNDDWIEGDGIVTSGGRVLSTTHILTSLPASYSGVDTTPGIDQIRMVSIADQFASWLRREMGL